MKIICVKDNVNNCDRCYKELPDYNSLPNRDYFKKLLIIDKITFL
jgi:hypothetical protein